MESRAFVGPPDARTLSSQVATHGAQSAETASSPLFPEPLSRVVVVVVVASAGKSSARVASPAPSSRFSAVSSENDPFSSAARFFSRFERRSGDGVASADGDDDARGGGGCLS